MAESNRLFRVSNRLLSMSACEHRKGGRHPVGQGRIELPYPPCRGGDLPLIYRPSSYERRESNPLFRLVGPERLLAVPRMQVIQSGCSDSDRGPPLPKRMHYQAVLHPEYHVVAGAVLHRRRKAYEAALRLCPLFPRCSLSESNRVLMLFRHARSPDSLKLRLQRPIPNSNRGFLAENEKS